MLLLRLDRPIGAWLLFLPGLWGLLLAGAPAGRTAWLVALFAVGSVVMRGAGCVVNDMWDRDLDRKVARTAGRPLASGALGMRQAAALLAVLLAAGLLVLLQLPPLCWALGVGSLVLVGLYPLAKRVTWWPQLVMGFTFGFGAPMGYAAGTGQARRGLGRDLRRRHPVGPRASTRSTRTRTARTTRWPASAPPRGCGASARGPSCSPATGWPSPPWPGRLAGRAVRLVLRRPAGCRRRCWPGRSVRLDIHDPAGCLRLFRSNREVGLAVAAAILLGRL